MKTISIAAAALLLLPTFTEGLVGIDWKVSEAPSSGMVSITFPFSIAEAPHKTGYFFAQQFNFIGQSDVGYTGLQPRPDINGKPMIHAVFSSFIGGTTTTDTQCSSGADGGPGVSCAVDFSAPYTHIYNLEVQKTSGTTWSGTVVDIVTGERIHIGSYTLPSDTKGIQSSQVGFIEYYPWNDGQAHSCNTLPYTSVVFGVPMALTAGSLGNAYEYGECVGKVNFRSARTLTGVQVQVGF